MAEPPGKQSAPSVVSVLLFAAEIASRSEHWPSVATVSAVVFTLIVLAEAAPGRAHASAAASAATHAHGYPVRFQPGRPRDVAGPISDPPSLAGPTLSALWVACQGRPR